ncbi:MAG: hypothetical protein Q9184_007846 [Pyrenodesmia sp. 2 TL-2023]
MVDVRWTWCEFLEFHGVKNQISKKYSYGYVLLMRFDDKGKGLRPVGEVKVVPRLFEEVALVAVSGW